MTLWMPRPQKVANTCWVRGGGHRNTNINIRTDIYFHDCIHLAFKWCQLCITTQLYSSYCLRQRELHKNCTGSYMRQSGITTWDLVKQPSIHVTSSAVKDSTCSGMLLSMNTYLRSTYGFQGAHKSLDRQLCMSKQWKCFTSNNSWSPWLKGIPFNLLVSLITPADQQEE